MSTKGRLRRLIGEVGDVLEAHDTRADLEPFAKWKDDPVGFVRDVVGDEPYSRQVDVLRAVHDHRNVSVRSCNAAGKSKCAAWLALWWCYARQGLAVLTAPTERQLTEQVMRREVWSAFSKAKPELPGTLTTNALRPHGEGAAGIIAKTATTVSSMTGWHDSAVLYVIDEAQDFERLDPHAWDAAFAVATGAEDRKLALGNPLSPTGRFFETHQPGSDWKSLRIAASDVPNVREGRTVVPGLLTQEAVDDIAKEYGAQSGFYQARVLAEYPELVTRGVFRRAWLDAAAESGRRRRQLAEAHEAGTRYTLAVDVGYEVDRSAVAVRRGPVLERIETWTGLDTSETAERVHKLAREMGPVSAVERDKMKVRTIVVDAIGLGQGVFDRLKDKPAPWSVKDYKASRSAKADDRYRNRRSESYWKLRKRLEDGEVSLPANEDLFRELLAHRWRDDGSGRIALESKKDVQKRIGSSPDLADAVAMAFDTRSPPRQRIVKFSPG